MPIQIDRDADKILPGAAAVRAEPFHMAGWLNLFVFEKADEHEAVNDALRDSVSWALLRFGFLILKALASISR